MIVKHKLLFKNLNHKFKREYYILDDCLDEYLKIIQNKYLQRNDSNKRNFGYFDVSGYLLVLEIKKVDLNILKKNKEQIYYRIFNGSHVFWAEDEDFEQVI